MRGRGARGPIGWRAILVATLALASPAGAEPAKCRQEISKAAIGYAQKVERAVEACKQKALAKGIGLESPDSFARCSVTALKTPAGSALGKAAAKMQGAIAKKCGGTDKSCALAADDDTLAAINWDIGICMSFPAAGADCPNAIQHCGDVATCLECIVDHTVEQVVDGILFDSFDPASFFPANAASPGKPIAKCQATVAKQGAKFLTASVRVLQKCWDLKLKGKAGFADADPCPDTDPKLSNGKLPALPGDNATIQKIRAAEQKQVAGICKQCGGTADKNKDLACDASGQTVGGVTIALGDIVETPLSCPAVHVPPSAAHPTGEDCSQHNPVDTLQKYVDCLDCQLDFKADCLSFAGLGDGSIGAAGGIAYPAACKGL